MLKVRPHKGHRAQRTGLWAKSKSTNLSRFNPYVVEMDQVFLKHDLLRRRRNLLITACPTHPRFIMPVSETDIRAELSRVPQEFLSGLNAVILLGGSKKQEKTYRSLFKFGCYLLNVIFLCPYPKTAMRKRYKTLPKPSILAEYERAGAQIRRSNNGCEINFDETSLRTFYLRDVLIHELGHHVDRDNFKTKTKRRIESFADWFASEYGYRLRI